tara:strand:- start:969 stop:1178 length:210 start_codon:yes stop_codon:yes gene_type:complete
MDNKNDIITQIKEWINIHLNTNPYMLLGYSALTISGSGFLGLCCLFPLALDGSITAFLSIGIFWSYLFL